MPHNLSLTIHPPLFPTEMWGSSLEKHSNEGFSIATFTFFSACLVLKHEDFKIVVVECHQNRHYQSAQLYEREKRAY